MQRQRCARALSSLIFAHPGSQPSSHLVSHALPSFFLSSDDKKAEHRISYNIFAFERRCFSGGFDVKSIFEDFMSPTRIVTSIIILMNVLVYTAEIFLGAGLFSSFAQINYLVSKGQIYRIVTAAFLHSGFFHLLGNMLSLHWIGPDLENIVGRSLFLFLFLVGAAGGGVAHLILGSQYTVLVGASAAVLGLLSALVTLKLQNPNFYPFTPNDSSWLGQIVAINVAIAFMSGGGISHIGHLGGVVAGAGAMYLFGPRYRWGKRGEGVINRPIIPLFK